VLSNLWEFVIKGDTDCVPAIGSDGTIYLGNFDGRFWALSPDGESKWIFETSKAGKANIEIRSSPAIGADGSLYFGCRDSRVYALSGDGSLKWTFETGGWVDSSPALGADGTIYVGSWDHSFYALSPDGNKKWAFATKGVVTSSPVINREGSILIGSHDGKMYCLSPDGTKRWEYNAGAQIISSPAIDGDDMLCITSVDGMFHALNPDGTLRWKLKTGGVTASSPVIGEGGNIYVGVNKNLWAISREGRKLWDHPATYDAYQQPIHAAPVAMADGTIMLVSGYGLLVALDQQRTIVWQSYVYGFGSGGPAVAKDGTIYVPSSIPNVGRCMTALSNSVQVARSPWPKFRGPQGNGRAE
jgi:outer membrane protein assembly factor BamB